MGWDVDDVWKEMLLVLPGSILRSDFNLRNMKMVELKMRCHIFT